MQEMIRHASQDAAQRTSENLELLEGLAETMASSVRETSSEMVEWAKQASKQQQEATRQIIQARSLDEVLDTQNRYVRAICRHCSTSVPRYSTAQPTRLASRATNCRRRISGKLEAVYSGEIGH